MALEVSICSLEAAFRKHWSNLGATETSRSGIESFLKGWIQKSREMTFPLYRSPLFKVLRSTPRGEPVRYTYERTLNLKFLEKAWNPEPPSGWVCETVLFKSEKALYWCLLQALENLWLPTAHKRLRVNLLDPSQALLYHIAKRSYSGVQHRVLKNQKRFERALKLADVDVAVFSLDGLNCLRLAEGLVEAPRQPHFLVLDLCQGGEEKVSEALLTLLPQATNFVLTLRRGYFDEQLGFPIMQPSGVTIYAPTEHRQTLKAVDSLLCKLRRVSGVGLSFQQAWSLLLFEDGRSYRSITLGQRVSRAGALYRTLQDRFPVTWEDGSGCLYFDHLEEAVVRRLRSLNEKFHYSSLKLLEDGRYCFRPGVLSEAEELWP